MQIRAAGKIRRSFAEFETRISDEYYATGQRDVILRQIPNAQSTPVFKQIYDAITAVQQGKKLTAEEQKRRSLKFERLTKTASRSSSARF
jgi:hypothetical protein